jgi:hypothetical protein
LKDAGGGAAESLTGEAGLEPSGTAEEEVFFGEPVGASGGFSETGGTTKGSGRPACSVPAPMLSASGFSGSGGEVKSPSAR